MRALARELATVDAALSEGIHDGVRSPAFERVSGGKGYRDGIADMVADHDERHGTLTARRAELTSELAAAEYLLAQAAADMGDGGKACHDYIERVYLRGERPGDVADDMGLGTWASRGLARRIAPHIFDRNPERVMRFVD